MKKSFTLALLGALTTSIGATTVEDANKQQFAGMAMESGLDAAAIADVKTTKTAMSSKIASAMTDLSGKDSAWVQDAGDFAAGMAMESALLAADPTALQAMLKGGMTSASNGPVAKTFGPESVDSMQAGVALESFLSQDLGQSQYFSAAAAVLQTRQDGAAELFFPSIPFAMNVDGVTVEIAIVSIFEGYTRKANGDVNPKARARKSIIKNIYEAGVFGASKNRIYPVVAAGREDKLDGDNGTSVLINGKSTNIAPIKFGKEVELVNLSKTEAQLNERAGDETDGIDRTNGLSQVFFKTTASVGGNDVTETFSFGDLEGSIANFIPSGDGLTKDMTLNYNSREITLTAGKTKTSGDIASVILSDLPENTKITLNVSISGGVALGSGAMKLYGNEISLVEVKNAAGAVLTSGAVYNKVVAFTGEDKMSLVSYYPLSYRALENLSEPGIKTTVDKKVFKFNVPFRPSSEVVAPVKNIGGGSTDADLLDIQASISSIDQTAHAYNTLLAHFDKLEQTLSGVNVNFDMIGAESLNTTFIRESVDCVADLNGMSSGDREADLKGLIGGKLKIMAARLFKASNMGVAGKILNKGVAPKMTVIAITDSVTGAYLEGLSLGKNFDFKYEITEDPRFDGQIHATFGVFGSTRNSAPHELNSGQVFVCPPVTLAATSSANKSIVEKTVTLTRFQHFINTPIGMKLTIANLEEAITTKV